MQHQFGNDGWVINLSMLGHWYAVRHHESTIVPRLPITKCASKVKKEKLHKNETDDK